MITGANFGEHKMSPLVALEHIWDAVEEELRSVMLYARGDKIAVHDVEAVQDAGWQVADVDSESVAAMNAATAAAAKEAVSHQAEPEVAGSPRATETAVEVAALREQLAAHEAGGLTVSAEDHAAVLADAEAKTAEVEDLKVKLEEAQKQAEEAASAAPAEPAPDETKEGDVPPVETKDQRGPKDKPKNGGKS